MGGERRETRETKEEREEKKRRSGPGGYWVIGYFVICKWKEVKEWKGRKSLVSGVLTWK